MDLNRITLNFGYNSALFIKIKFEPSSNQNLRPTKIQGVHCDMIESKCIFWAEKLISQA